MRAQSDTLTSCCKGLPVSLVPMSGAQYERFIKVSVDNQVRNQVLAGRLDPGQAAEITNAQLGRMLPQGINTPGHEFYAVVSEVTGEHVGDVWFTTVKRPGREIGFVMDIQVHPAYRRQGYGTAAFAAIERLAVEKGLDEMALEVAGHNAPARAMYQKLGYREIGVSMAKKLDRQGVERDPGL